MYSLSPEVQEALAECREEMAAILHHEQALMKQNEKLCQENEELRQEYLRMQNSLSWKITKPLRLIKKTIHSLRTVGLRLTLVKIFNHWK